MPTTITITRATQLHTDVDNDGVADAGDVLRTFLHILNVGAQDALNLSVSDNFTGSTFVPGSLKITPIAFDDNYTGVTGNTPITYAANQGVLVNDVDPDGAGGNAGVSVTQVNGTTISGVPISITGGTVNMQADGGFTFVPTTGFNGTATFNYSVVDAQGLNNVTTGTVTIQVNGGMVWYVDNSFAGGGNDGSYLHPFTQLTQLNGVTGDGTTNDDVDGSGDTIFVYHNGAAYTAGITLEAGQTLLGDGQSLLVNGHNIGGTERTGGVDNVATNSVIDNNGANGGITLSTDNVIKGLNVNGLVNGAVGIQDGNGAVSTGGNQLVISNVALTGVGQLIDIDQGGKASISLNSLSSTGSTGANGGVVDLTGLAAGSAFTVTGTTGITGTHSQSGIDISGNSGVTVDFQGNVTVNNGAQNALVIDNNTGTNSATFGGTANTFTTTTGNAVEMTGNTVAGTTINLTNGGLNIDTTTGTGLNVGATTINIAGASNTIDTTSGQILVASNAAVGASGVTLATLTNTLATTAGNAVDISNLDGGSFTVSGNVTIAGSSADAINIRAGSSTNFAFNGTTDINGATGDGVELNGSNGTVSFANLQVDAVGGNGLSIQNATATVTVTNGAIGATNDPAGDGVNITGGGAAVTIGAAVTKTSAGDTVEVNGHTAGAVTFSGAMNASTGASGINLVNNTGGTIDFSNAAVNLSTGANTALNFTNTAGTGAAVSFTGGNLNIDTTSGTGINATTTTANAGTLTISGANNSVVATTGRAINVDGVTSDLTFHDVSKNGGTTTAIFLRNTDGAGHNSGQFVITGTGTTAGTGGTLQSIDDAGTNATGATANQTGSGIEMTNVSNVSLSNMTIGANLTTIANLGIHGEGVNNFTLKDTNFLGNFGDTGATGPDEDVIRFGTQNAANNGLIGTGSFLGNNIQGGARDNIAIFNGGAGSLNFSFTDSASHQAVMGHNQTGGNTGIQIQTGGTAGNQGGGFNLTASITNAQFDGNRADSIFIEALQHTTQNISVTGNTYNGTQSDALGGFVNVNGGSSTGTNYLVSFNIANNSITGSFATPIVAVYNGKAGDISGTILTNTIGTNNGVTTNSGSADGNGIFAAVDRAGDEAGTLIFAVRIDGNNVSDLFRPAGGIALRANNGGGIGSATLQATVQNNHVQELGAQALSALFLQLGGGAPGDNGVLGIDLKNNVFVATNNQLAVVDIDQVSSAGGAHLNVPNYPAASPTSGQSAANALATFWTTTNTNSFTQGGAAFSAYGANLAGVTHNAFTHSVPLMAVVPPVVPWEDDPANQALIHVTSDQGEQPPVTIATADPGTGGFLPSTAPSGGPSGGPAVVDASVLGHPTVVDDGVVSQAELSLIVDAAIQRWAEAGLSPEQLVAMRAVEVTVSDMMGLYVGASSAGQIHIDSDAAGYGWFVDATPDGDSEFDGSGSRLTAEAGGPADHRIDLLTVVMHELGHQIGLDDTYASGNFAELMYGYVNPGERRLPETGDAAGAVPGSLTHEEYAIGPITNVTTLPAGKGVDIIFDTQVNTFSNQVIPTFPNQASVSGTNLTSSPVTSNVETLVPDSLTLGDRIFLDVNKNGVYDSGTDTGVAGVTLTLYADNNQNGVLDGAEATTIIATATTLAGGLYSFASLAPGDYVVSIDAANFTGGGALVGKINSAGGTDPDDNVDNDDNGVVGPGGTIISAPIRLDFNSEPTAGTGNDTNNTLDFGFLSPNQAPVFTNIDGNISTFTEGGSPVKLDVLGDATLNDDNTNFNNGTLTLHIGAGAVAGEDVLSASSGTVTLSGGTATVSAQNIGSYTGGTAGADLVFSFNANATPALVQDLIRALNYSNSNNVDPDTNTRSIAITLVDGGGTDGGAGADTSAVNVLVNVTPVNDPPAGQDNSDTTSETTTLVFNAADFNTGFTDPDHNAFAGVVITTLPPGADGKIQLNNVDIAAGQFVTLAQLSGGNLTFVPVAGSAGDSPTFTFQVRDDGGVLNSGVDTDQSPNTFTIAITSPNNPPVLDLDADNSSGATLGDYATTYTEGGAAVAVADTDVSITDADVGDNITSATISLSDPEAGDQLTVIGSLPGSIVAAGAGTDTIMLSGTGTRAEYQQALTQIAFSSTSDNPTIGGTHNDRSIGVIVNDGTSNSAPSTVTVTVIGVDDPPVVHPDAVATNEATVLAGSVFANNGSGADSDVDGPPLSVSAVNGSGANVGVQITLASGAKLTLNANGTFSYDPNHAFDATPAANSGASNMPAHDSFTYTLTGGGTATVSVTIAGLDSDDQLYGTGGNDSLFGGVGRDVLGGFGGDDILSGGAGVANVLIGGMGNDIYIVQAAGDTLVEQPNEGTDRVLTALATYSIETRPNIENLTGFATTGQTLTGNDNDNVIIASSGNDRLFGGLGHDVLAGFDGNDLLAGGDGVANEVVGGLGDDTYIVTAQGDTLVEMANEGTDTVLTTLSSYTLRDNFEDLLFTGSGNFTGTGNNAANIIGGGAGDDRLSDGTGAADTLIGGAGNDTYVVTVAGDTIVEQFIGGGTDTVETALSSYHITAPNVENLTGTSGAGQTLIGSAIANVITGAGGNDLLDGGIGADTLIGNAGADYFLFDSTLGGGNVDTIMDFVSGSDRILLDNAIFTQLNEGGLPPSVFVIGTAAGDADDRIIYDNTTGALYYDADGNGAGAAVQFATLSGHPILTANDFGVI